MATVTGLTKTRMLEIENESIVAARMEGYNLILTTFGGLDINVGNVRGEVGPIGQGSSETIINGITVNSQKLKATFTSPDTVAGTVPNAETGQSFVQSAETGTPGWRILNNALVDTSISNESYIFADARVSDFTATVVLTALPIGGSDGAGLKVRATDSNNWIGLHTNSSGNYQIYKRVAGVFTQIGTVAKTPVVGDVLSLVCAGSTITASVGGVSTTVTETAGQTNTKIGLRLSNAGATKNAAFDNLIVVGAPSPRDVLTMMNVNEATWTVPEPGPETTNASLLTSGTLDDARLTARLQAAALTSSFGGSSAGTSGKPLLATDSSVTNARTPTAHAASHASGGADLLGRGSPGTNMGAPKTSTDNGTPSSGATETRDAILGNYQFTSFANRRYQVFLTGLVGNGSVAGEWFDFNIRNGGSSTPTAASALIASNQFSVLASSTAGRLPVPLSGSFVPGAGIQTLAMFTVRKGGSSGVCTPVPTYSGLARELFVVDLGPV